MTEKRLDANEVAFLSQQLEYLAKDRAVEIEYLGLQAMNFIDVNASAQPGMATFAYYELDMSGDEAQWLTSNGDDISLVDVSSVKQVVSVYRAAEGFAFNSDELQEEAVASMGLIPRRREAARRAVMRKADNVAAFGDAEKGLKGLANHSNVNILGAAAPATGSDKAWAGGDKIPMEILADLFSLANKVEEQTKGNHKANVLLLPLVQLHYIEQTPLDSGGTNSDSILTAFKKNRPGIDVQVWHKLELADAAGTGPRALAYERDRMNMEFLITDPLKEDPIYQAGPRRFEVALTMKFGGVVLYKPLAVAYMDDI